MVNEINNNKYIFIGIIFLLFFSEISFSINDSNVKGKFFLSTKICPGCSYLSIESELKNLNKLFPSLNNEIYIEVDNIIELNPLKKIFPNNKILPDTNRIWKKIFNLKILPSFVLTDNDSIVYTQENIKDNHIVYENISNYLKLKNKNIKLTESLNNELYIVGKPKINYTESSLALIDYQVNSIKIFDFNSGDILSNINIQDTLKYLYRKNIDAKYWNLLENNLIQFASFRNIYIENDSFVSLVDIIDDAKIEIDSINYNEKKLKIDTFASIKLLKSSYFVKYYRNEIININKIIRNKYNLLNIEKYDDKYISTIYLNNSINLNEEEFYFKIFDGKNNEKLLLNNLDVKQIGIKQKVNPLFNAQTYFDFYDNNLLFLNTYFGIFGIKSLNNLIKIHPYGVLNDIINYDSMLTFEEFIKKSKTGELNKNLVLSCYFDSSNAVNIVLAKYNDDNYIEEVILQKYNYYGEFVFEKNIYKSDKNDVLLSLLKVEGKNNSYFLTKWKNRRWRILDITNIK